MPAGGADVRRFFGNANCYEAEVHAFRRWVLSPTQSATIKYQSEIGVTNPSYRKENETFWDTGSR